MILVKKWQNLAELCCTSEKQNLQEMKSYKQRTFPRKVLKVPPGFSSLLIVKIQEERNKEVTVKAKTNQHLI